MKPISVTLAVLAALALPSPASAQIGAVFCSGNPNSTGAASVIAAEGSTVVVENDVTLTCTDLPQDAFGYFITGTTPGAIFNPGGSAGTLCITGPIGRYAGNIMTSGSSGSVSMAVDLTALPSPTGNLSAQPGDAWIFQFWHRDTSPSGPTSNFSPGIIIDFLPAVPTFRDDVWPILATTNIGAPACITCHQGASAPGGLNLGFTPQMGYTALVNAPSAGPACAGSIRVVPGDPAGSLLFDKLSNTPPSCGAQMPLGGTLAGDLNIIREWILAGAVL